MNTNETFGPAVKDFEFTVPADYAHDTQLDTFGKLTKKIPTTRYFNDTLTSKNFAKATTRLIPDKTYRVRVFPILQLITSDGCMTFLKKQNAILVGGQGITLLQQSMPDEFLVDKWIVSFDEKDALWKDPGGHRRVPYVGHRSNGDWGFRLGCFEYIWWSDYYLLCISNN